MFIYNNTCGINDECKSGYSLYFPCISTITRGENVCLDFYIVDNATKKEVDLREVDDITLNLFGRFNCNFGSFSYPENIKSLQFEKFSELVYDINFSDIINHVNLYIDIVDENHRLIESFLFDENLILDIDIEGAIGYFLNGSKNNSILNLKGFDTKTYMFLGWNIDENDGECGLENIYDFLIKDRNLIYNISEDCTIRAVYQKRREYTIKMDSNNFNSSFIIDYMGEKLEIQHDDSVKVLEGHDVKISCIPFNLKPYKFVKWDDGYKNPYRVLNISGDDLIILLKAHCSLNDSNDIEYSDNIDASILNNFKSVYPEIIDSIFIDEYYIDNIYINNCEIDILKDVPYIKIIENGYIQIINIDNKGNFKLSLNNIGGECKLFINNYEIHPSIVDNNEFVFEFDSGIMTLMGKDSCVFGLSINKEIIYDKGKCMLCLDSNNTLKLHHGDLTADGGVIVNGNPYGISSVKIAKVTNITPLIIK